VQRLVFLVHVREPGHDGLIENLALFPFIIADALNPIIGDWYLVQEGVDNLAIELNLPCRCCCHIPTSSIFCPSIGSGVLTSPVLLYIQPITGRAQAKLDGGVTSLNFPILIERTHRNDEGF